jgi:two-component system, chemotaxis family, chemotaxis protein CheY
MLVDDDPAILLTVGDQLVSEGYTVVKAESAEQCLSSLESVTPDLIILDISMPGAGGLSFLRSISNTDGTLRYPVLVFTARAELDRFFQDTAVNGFLPKTATPATFSEEVERIVRQRRAEQATARSGRWRIVLAEDDTKISHKMINAMKTAGYETVCVSTGYEVIRCAVMERPDVIVLKYVLPGMNGTAVASILAGMSSTQSVPVVLYDNSGLHRETSGYHNIREFVPTNSTARLLRAIESLRAVPPAVPATPGGPRLPAATQGHKLG